MGWTTRQLMRGRHEVLDLDGAPIGYAVSGVNGLWHAQHLNGDFALGTARSMKQAASAVFMMWHKRSEALTEMQRLGQETDNG